MNKQMLFFHFVDRHDGSLGPFPLPRQAGNVWTAKSLPQQGHITGGPWTLQQRGASNAAPSAGYCINGVPQPNPGTERMAPYYFAFVTEFGQDACMASLTIARATAMRRLWRQRPLISARPGSSTQEVLELNKGICPASDNVDLASEAGLGHPYAMTVNGRRFLYNLDRRPGQVDVSGLVIHELFPQAGAPLNPVPATVDFAAPRTVGLLNPDGIIAEVPGSSPKTILYVQKILNGDRLLPRPCRWPSSADRPVVFNEPAASHDISIPRMASTEDGINFTDLGPDQRPE